VPLISLAFYVKSNKIHIRKYQEPSAVLHTRVTLFNKRTLITLVNHVIPRHRSDFRSSRNLVANRMLSRNAPGIFEVGIPMGVHSSAANDILNGVSDLNFCIRTDEFRSLRTQPDKLGRTSPVMGIIEREESISL